MPYKDKPIEKLYYSIGEVADILGESTSLIRFWETEFDDIKPSKNSRGNRVYKKEDLELLKTIHYLVKQKGYTLSGAQDKLKGNTEEVSKNKEIYHKLKDIKKLLLELKHRLD